MERFTVHIGDSFNLDELIVGNELDLQPVPVDPRREAEQQNKKGSTTDVAEEHDPWNEDIGEEPTVSEQKLKRSARVRRTLRCFDYIATAVIEDPMTIEEDLESSETEQYQKAVKEKLMSMDENDTWTKLCLPPRKTERPCRTKFKGKLYDKGSVSRFKARLVANRFLQKEDIDYSETFAPVVAFEIFLLLVRKFVSKAWLVFQVDSYT